MNGKKIDRVLKNKDFVKGYEIGMRTAFDFVIKYCEDMKDAYGLDVIKHDD